MKRSLPDAETTSTTDTTATSGSTGSAVLIHDGQYYFTICLDVLCWVILYVDLKDIFSLSCCNREIRKSLLSVQMVPFLSLKFPEVKPLDPLDPQKVVEYQQEVEFLQEKVTFLGTIKSSFKQYSDEEQWKKEEALMLARLDHFGVDITKATNFSQIISKVDRKYYKTLFQLEQQKQNLETKTSLRKYLFYILYRNLEMNQCNLLSNWLCGYIQTMEEPEQSVALWTHHFQKHFGINFEFPVGLLKLYSVVWEAKGTFSEYNSQVSYSFALFEPWDVLVRCNSLLDHGYQPSWLIKNIPIFQSYGKYYCVNCDKVSPYWGCASKLKLDAMDSPNSKESLKATYLSSNTQLLLLHLCAESYNNFMLSTSLETILDEQFSAEVAYNNKKQALLYFYKGDFKNAISSYLTRPWKIIKRHPPVFICKLCKEEKLQMWDSKVCLVCSNDKPFIIEEWSEDTSISDY